MTVSCFCNMVWIYFRHIGSVGLAVYMDVFEVLSPEWLHFIVQFSGIFWKPFWRLHRLSVYMEEDMNPDLYLSGNTCPVCYIFPIHGFRQCPVADSCVSGTLLNGTACFGDVLYADYLRKLSFGTQKQCFKYVLYTERSNSCEIDTRKHRFMSILDKFLSFQPCKIYCRQTYSYMETVKKETSILSGNTFGDFHLSVTAII